MAKKIYFSEEEKRKAKNENQKRWRLKHQEKDKEYKKKYREKNKEHISEEYKKYYQKNKEKILERVKDYYKSNKDKAKEHSKKQKESGYQKKYRLTKKGRASLLLSNYKRHDKDKNRGKCTLTSKWFVENIFSGQKCVYCGEDDWTKLGCDRIDNDKPHTPDNVVCCCEECNKKRGTMSYDEFINILNR